MVWGSLTVYLNAPGNPGGPIAPAVFAGPLQAQALPEM